MAKWQMEVVKEQLEDKHNHLSVDYSSRASLASNEIATIEPISNILVFAPIDTQFISILTLS